MKKIIASILLVSVMLMTMIIPASAAAGDLSATATLSADKSTFTVSLNLKNNPGIVALTVEAEYDSKVLKLKSSDNGEVFSSVTPGPNDANPYKLIWYVVSLEDIKTNGALATYTFDVLKDAPIGGSEIKFSVTEAINANMEDVKFNPYSFKINVKNTADGNQSQANSQTDTSSNASATDSVSGDTETLEVEKPKFDNTDSETESTQTDSEVLEEDTASSEIVETIGTSDTDDKTDKNDGNSNRSLITILAIAIILILGGGITFIAIYARKKSAKK